MGKIKEMAMDISHGARTASSSLSAKEAIRKAIYRTLHESEAFQDALQSIDPRVFQDATSRLSKELTEAALEAMENLA